MQLRPGLGWRLRAAAASVAAAISCLALPARSEADILFVVAENPARGGSCVHCDSYLLPLSDPDAIEHARALIEGGGAGPGAIAVAHIAAGSDGINRDVLATGEPLWSWHVTDFVDFADTTIEILDGWPTFVESDVDGWIANTNGTIGFWSYTVVRELPEPSSGVSALAALAALVFLRRGARRAAREPTEPLSERTPPSAGS
jgi:hypothetical protein